MRCSARMAPGKSTLVKCVMGFYQPTEGQLLIGDREVEINDPRDAHANGLGMVYQHFTLVPSPDRDREPGDLAPATPAIIDWKAREGAARRLPGAHAVPHSARPAGSPSSPRARSRSSRSSSSSISSRRFLILDEPTSVLTPGESRGGAGPPQGHGQCRRAHHPDDHPQVPRGRSLLPRTSAVLAPRQASPARARPPSSAARRWRR